MKKMVLIIILTFFCLSVDASACMEINFGPCPHNNELCCSFARTTSYDPVSCELTVTPERPIRQSHAAGACPDAAPYNAGWQGSSCVPTEEEEGTSVGGCNGSPAYFSACEGGVYDEATAFTDQFSDIDKWWYFTSMGNDGNKYMCMSAYKNTSGGTIINTISDFHEVNPVDNDDCLSEDAFAALNNNADDLSNPTTCGQESNALNSGIKTTYGDPDSTEACDSNDPDCKIVAFARALAEMGCSGSNRGNSCSDCSKGAPVWSINMVNMNLFMTDTPMWHDPPIGPSVRMQVSYNSEGGVVEGAPFGNNWVFRYSSYLHEDDVNDIVTVYMPDGREDVYTPDVSGYTNETGVLNALTKTADNDFSLEFPDGTVYVYDRAGTDTSQTLLTEITDAYEQALTIEYITDTDKLLTITDATGHVYNFTYTGDHVIEITDGSYGRSSTFVYDNNKLTQITDMGGYVASFEYDGNYLKSITDNGGEIWDFDIEPSNGVIGSSNPYPAPGEAMGNNYRITITDPLGNKEEYYYYGPYSWYISQKDYVPYTAAESNNYASAPKTIYYFNRGIGNGKIGRIVTPVGGRTDYSEFDDVSGKPGLIKDFHGTNAAHTDESHYTYQTFNAKGLLASSTDAKGNVTTYEYFPNDIDVQYIKLDLAATPENDDITLKSFTYNGSMHDVQTVTDRLGIITEFLYNQYSQVGTVTEAKNSSVEMLTEMTYDPGTHELMNIKKNGNTVSSFTYDNVGRVDTSTDDKGITLDYDYDDLNRLTKTTWPNTKFETIVYSGCCPKLVESQTDRAGLTTTYTYNELKRLKEVHGPSGMIKFEYDRNGNRTRLIDQNGKETVFTYDLDNRLEQKTFANGKYEKYTYDPAGLLTKIERSRSGLTVTYREFDNNHNLRITDYSDSTPDVEFTYNNYDRLYTMDHGTYNSGNGMLYSDGSVYEYGYDDIHRLTGIDSPWDNDKITYEYNDLSHRTKMIVETGPLTTSVADYFYDYDTGYSELDLGRLKEIQTGSNTYTYNYTDVNPLVQSLTRPNGSVSIYSYVDSLKRLAAIDNQDSAKATVNKHSFTYNDLDVIDTVAVTTGTALDAFTDDTKTYQYNNVNQLTNSTNPAQSFTYDDDGNMTQGYTPDGYQYIATYDAENRLETLTYNDGVDTYLTEYYYSGDGFLAKIAKKVNGNQVSETRFIRAGFLPVQERNKNNNIQREYTWGLGKGGGIGGLLSMKEGTENYSYLYDGKGNVMVVLDSSQNVVASYRYDVFGNLLKKSGTLDQPFQFSTKRFDEKTGLSYYGYRFYSPMIGRWMNRDPLGEFGGINLYGFVRNNSINLVDPWGKKPLYGNYCGSGNNPEDPIDYLDYMCMLHDTCYKDSGLSATDVLSPPEEGLQSTEQQMCDLNLCVEAQSFRPSTNKQRVVRRTIISLFCDKGGM